MPNSGLRDTCLSEKGFNEKRRKSKFKKKEDPEFWVKDDPHSSKDEIALKALITLVKLIFQFTLGPQPLN